MTMSQAAIAATHTGAMTVARRTIVIGLTAFLSVVAVSSKQKILP